MMHVAARHTTLFCSSKSMLALMIILLMWAGIAATGVAGSSSLKPEGERLRQLQQYGGGPRRPEGLRRLMQAASTVNVTVVRTAKSLVAAVARGDPHIEIREHLNMIDAEEDEADAEHVYLSLPSTDKNGLPSTDKNGLPSTVKSIRGNCNTQPNSVMIDLLGELPPPQVSNQCILVVRFEFLKLQQSSLWLDGLMLRSQHPPSEEYEGELPWANPMIHVFESGKLWMTGVSLLGDGDGVSDCSTCALRTGWFIGEEGQSEAEGQVYAEGCSFENFDGDRVISAEFGRVTLKNSVLRSNNMTESVVAALTDTGFVSIANTTISNSVTASTPTLLAWKWRFGGDPAFYADDTLAVTRKSIAGRLSDAQSEPLADWPASQGLTAKDPFLVSMQAEVTAIPNRGFASAPAPAAHPAAPAPTPAPAPVPAPAPAPAAAPVAPVATPPPSSAAAREHTTTTTEPVATAARPPPSPQAAPPPAAAASAPVPPGALADTTAASAGTAAIDAIRSDGGSGSGGSSRSTGNLAAAVIVAFVLITSTLCFVFFILRKRRRRANLQPQPDDGAVLVGVDPGKLEAGTGPSSFGSPSHSGIGMIMMSQPAESTSPGTDTSDSTMSGQRTLWPPHGGATTEQRLDFVVLQLRSVAGKTVANGLVLDVDDSSRVRGGQAVVQFATFGHLEYAMKFFGSQTAFQKEAELYGNPENPLYKFLPPMHSIMDNADGALVDAEGNPLPPCIVMERGKSLNFWARGGKPKMEIHTCMQILYQVCERLAELHGAGYVHRDLKPAHIMWLPSLERWTLIDFGCTARIGEAAPMLFSLKYAAPEVVTACFRKHERSMVVSPAVDLWALGVVAVELFSGKPAFDVFTTKPQIIASLVGEEALAWEDETTMRRQLKTAGQYRGAILTLLQRDPAQRPSVDNFQHHCAEVTNSASTPQATSSTATQATPSPPSQQTE